MEHKLTKEQKHSLYTHTELHVHTYMQYDQSWAEIPGGGGGVLAV